MRWIYLMAQMVVPLGVAVYTINFGRWMASKQNKSGAYAAYVLAAIALAVTLVALLRHNV